MLMITHNIAHSEEKTNVQLLSNQTTNQSEAQIYSHHYHHNELQASLTISSHQLVILMNALRSRSYARKMQLITVQAVH